MYCVCVLTPYLTGIGTKLKEMTNDFIAGLKRL